MENINKKILKALNEAQTEQKVPSNWTLNDDGSYDVKGNIEPMGGIRSFIKNGKFTVKFNKVSGSFNCDLCRLKTLEGVPEEVGGDFRCTENELTTLEGAPEKVGGAFLCFKNKLISLDGCTKKVKSFDCSDNNLTTLDGAPEKVSGYFGCANNKLTSLEGLPKKAGALFAGGNSINLTREEVREVFNIKGKIII